MNTYTYYIMIFPDTHTNKNTHTSTHARTHAHTRAHTHTQSRTHAHKRTQTHATTHSARTQTHTAGRACTRLRATCMHMRHAPAIKTALKKSSHACACACACMQFTYYIYMRAFLHERRAEISAFAPAAPPSTLPAEVVFACVGTSPKRAATLPETARKSQDTARAAMLRAQA